MKCREAAYIVVVCVETILQKYYDFSEKSNREVLRILKVI